MGIRRKVNQARTTIQSPYPAPQQQVDTGRRMAVVMQEREVGEGVEVGEGRGSAQT